MGTKAAQADCGLSQIKDATALEAYTDLLCAVAAYTIFIYTFFI
jgi:hypothetical protein